MGGCGSGSWYRWNSRRTTGSSLSLDVRRFQRDGYLVPGKSFSWAWSNDAGEKLATIGIRVEKNLMILNYRVGSNSDDLADVSEPVPLEWMSCNYGGFRPWFRCPGVKSGVHCGRRVAILYGPGKFFLCRHCYDLAYSSQNASAMDRPMYRAQRIRRRLGGSASLMSPFPWKPRGLHWKTYWRLRREAERAESKSWIMLDIQLERLRSKLP